MMLRKMLSSKQKIDTAELFIKQGAGVIPSCYVLRR